MRRLADAMGVRVTSMPTGSFGWGGLMLQDPKPPMIPNETSLLSYPDASMKMYDINKYNNQKTNSKNEIFLLIIFVIFIVFVHRRFKQGAVSTLSYKSPIDWGDRIHPLHHLCRWVRPPTTTNNKCPRYDTKQSDDGALVLKLCGIVEYRFISITPRSTPTRSGSTW